MNNPPVPTVARVPLRELARTFFILGVLGFGGPAAHLALMESELVTRKQWIGHDYFLDLLAAINLMPGPNSTEMALQLGLLTGGIPGMLLAGAGFIGPAVVLSTALAILYVAAGSLPAVRGLLLGVQPVVLVLILSAAYRLGRKAIDEPPMRVLLVLSLLAVAISSPWLMALFGLTPLPIPELALLLTSGLVYVLWKYRPRVASPPDSAVALIVFLLNNFQRSIIPLERVIQSVAAMPSPGDVFWRFFVIGATLFGSGHLLAAYMQRTFVDGLHWMTPQQLLDTLAIGQATPGPLTSTSAAAGYVMTVQPGNLLSGIPGAVTAAVGAFLPAFAVVMILGKVVPYLRRYPIALAFLKGVNAGVIALLLGAFASLAYSTLVALGVDWLSLALTVVAFVLLERFRWSPIALIAVGAGVGILRALIGV